MQISPNKFRACLIRNICIFLAACLPAFSAQAAEEFGRFFTTSAQRTQLDALRRTGPEVAVEIADVDLDADQTAAAPADPQDAVTLKGVVRRSDGANTAWINESNTNEGNLAAQDIRVPKSRIGDNQVDLNIGDRPAPITLKVGETYDPVSNRVLDVTKESESVDTVSD
jgi:hypothetical protein